MLSSVYLSTVQPRYGELALILVLGLLQPVLELSAGMRVAAYYNVFASLIVLGYIVFRIQQAGRTVFREWGIRLDTLQESLLPHFGFAAIAGGVLYAYGWFAGYTPLPSGFWYILGLYPVWGFAQQFVLQNFVARNLMRLVPSLGLRSMVTALLFAGAHLPSVELTALAFIAGFTFTVLYHRYTNLLTLSVAHGMLGALAFYLVLGQNQWTVLVRYFS